MFIVQFLQTGNVSDFLRNEDDEPTLLESTQQSHVDYEEGFFLSDSPSKLLSVPLSPLQLSQNSRPNETLIANFQQPKNKKNDTSERANTTKNYDGYNPEGVAKYQQRIQEADTVKKKTLAERAFSKWRERERKKKQHILPDEKHVPSSPPKKKVIMQNNDITLHDARMKLVELNGKILDLAIKRDNSVLTLKNRDPKIGEAKAILEAAKKEKEMFIKTLPLTLTDLLQPEIEQLQPETMELMIQKLMLAELEHEMNPNATFDDQERHDELLQKLHDLIPVNRLAFTDLESERSNLKKIMYNSMLRTKRNLQYKENQMEQLTEKINQLISKKYKSSKKREENFEKLEMLMQTLENYQRKIDETPFGVKCKTMQNYTDFMTVLKWPFKNWNSAVDDDDFTRRANAAIQEGKDLPVPDNEEESEFEEDDAFFSENNDVMSVISEEERHVDEDDGIDEQESNDKEDDTSDMEEDEEEDMTKDEEENSEEADFAAGTSRPPLPTLQQRLNIISKAIESHFPPKFQETDEEKRLRDEVTRKLDEDDMRRVQEERDEAIRLSSTTHDQKKPKKRIAPTLISSTH